MPINKKSILEKSNEYWSVILVITETKEFIFKYGPIKGGEYLDSPWFDFISWFENKVSKKYYTFNTEDTITVITKKSIHSYSISKEENI